MLCQFSLWRDTEHTCGFLAAYLQASDLAQQPERLGDMSLSEISFAAWTNYRLGTVDTQK